MKASETYRHPDYMHNCCQALAYKFAHLYGGDVNSVLARFASSGGGRAEGGMCGALYAAVCAFPDKRDEVVRRFADKTGSFTTCSDLKTKGRIPCKTCIDFAEEVIAAMQENA